MTLLGGFTPVVLHDPSQRQATIDSATATARLFQQAGATKFVSAVVQDWDWAIPRPLTADEQRHMAEMFGVIDEICEEHGLQQVLHSHVQTLVETKDDINRVLDTCDVNFCLDTGHMAIGGQDPVAFAKEAMERVGHVHLKDVRLDMVPPVLRREVTLMAATQAGLFTPLGQGDVDILGVVQTLEAAGYRGWYVIEQDTAITEGLPPEGEGPIHLTRTRAICRWALSKHAFKKARAHGSLCQQGWTNRSQRGGARDGVQVQQGEGGVQRLRVPHSRQGLQCRKAHIISCVIECIAHDVLAARDGGQRAVGSGKVDRCRQEIDTIRGRHHQFGGASGRLACHEDRGTCLIEVLRVQPQGEGGARLRIEVDDEHPLAALGEGRAEVHHGRRLGDAALLVRHGQDSHHPMDDRPRVFGIAPRG
jgi:inosose dehydratase